MPDRLEPCCTLLFVELIYVAPPEMLSFAEMAACQKTGIADTVKNLTIKPGKQLYYTFENLVVSAQPDLVVEEDGNLILIKLNLSKKDFSGGVPAMLLHLLYEAAQMKGLPVKPTGVECLQTSSGSKTAGPKTGFSDKQALNAQCQVILALWSDEG